MNCTKCNNLLKDGAKFCTSCGTPVQQQVVAKGDSCPSCSAPLKDGAKFCTSCGTKIGQVAASQPQPQAQPQPQQPAAQPQSAKSLEMVKQKIVWNIMQGEVARSIKESEFIEYDNATGLIVDEGTTAYIRSGGKTLAQVSGGVYDFVAQEELDKAVAKRSGGVITSVKRGFKSLMNIILRRSDNGAVESEPSQEASLDAVVEAMRGNQLMALNLKLDRNFALIFGAEQSNLDDYAEFQPMKIRSKVLDLNVGVHALFAITDFEEFIKHYMADRGSITTTFLVNEITPIIRGAVEQVLGGVEVGDSQLSEEMLYNVRENIKRATAHTLHGLQVVKVINISIDEENLSRFRDLSRELYLSERELDFLIRSNDLKNRLNAQVDEQTIFDARREAERDRQLMHVNRDNLLTDEELDKFKLQLQLERALREARSAEELNKVQDQIEANGFQRLHALNVRKIEAQAELEKINLDRERYIKVNSARTDVETRRVLDNYEDERTEQSDKRKQERAKASMEMYEKMRAIKREDKREEHSMEMEQKREDNQTRLRSEELKSGMSAQQIMAMASEGNMDSAAAQRLAESFSAGADAEQQREFMDKTEQLNRERMEEQRLNADRMERMMSQMMNMTSNIAGGVRQEQEARKDEYRERLERQESRLDDTMDRSLNYATKNNAIESQSRSCPQCGETVSAEDKFCNSCCFKLQ